MTTPPSDNLRAIFARQRDLQINSYGHDPATLVGQPRADYFRTMSFALADEVHEAAKEIAWKPWAKSEQFNRDAYVGELVDALHFLVNLFLLADANADEVHDRYFAKAAVNEKRQKDGYDGLSTKCPDCGRALDDPAVTCGPGGCLVVIRIVQDAQTGEWTFHCDHEDCRLVGQQLTFSTPAAVEERADRHRVAFHSGRPYLLSRTVFLRGEE